MHLVFPVTRFQSIRVHRRSSYTNSRAQYTTGVLGQVLAGLEFHHQKQAAAQLPTTREESVRSTSHHFYCDCSGIDLEVEGPNTQFQGCLQAARYSCVQAIDTADHRVLEWGKTDEQGASKFREKTTDHKD